MQKISGKGSVAQFIQYGKILELCPTLVGGATINIELEHHYPIKAPTHIRKYGLSSTIGLVARLTVRRVFRNYMNPTLGEINSTAAASFTNVNALISELLHLGKERISELRQEYSKILDVIQAAEKSTPSPYPDNYGVEKESGFLIYSIVRTMNPKIFLETGVANGISSTIILSAMQFNEIGKLISFDVSADVGAVIPQHLKDRWELKLLRRPFKVSFLKELNSIQSVDVFCHDSDHSFQWQSFEYNSILNHIRKGGIMLSDDINSSYAFVDFVKIQKFRSYSLIETRNVFGAIPFG